MEKTENSNICRACLRDEDGLQSIFRPENTFGLTMNLSDMFSCCISIQVGFKRIIFFKLLQFNNFRYCPEMVYQNLFVINVLQILSICTYLNYNVKRVTKFCARN